VAAARDKGEAIRLGPLLLYSRPCVTTALPKAERDRKKFDYFFLTRDPRKGKEVTGHHLARVSEGIDSRDRRCIDFQFSREGGKRLYELTSENKPSGDGGFKRQLAVVVDGRILSAPVLLSPIRERGQITGEFTSRDIKALLEALRSDMRKGKE
jgi:preprotein translocase subunit SecD